MPYLYRVNTFRSNINKAPCPLIIYIFSKLIRMNHSFHISITYNHFNKKIIIKNKNKNKTQQQQKFDKAYLMLNNV